VFGAAKFEVLLRAVHETHGILLKAPDGTALMAPVSVHTLRQFKVGTEAELEQPSVPTCLRQRPGPRLV